MILPESVSFEKIISNQSFLFPQRKTPAGEASTIPRSAGCLSRACVRPKAGWNKTKMWLVDMCMVTPTTSINISRLNSNTMLNLIVTKSTYLQSILKQNMTMDSLILMKHHSVFLRLLLRIILMAFTGYGVTATTMSMMLLSSP